MTRNADYGLLIFLAPSPAIMFESEEKTVWKLALGPCERKNKSVVFRVSPSSSLIGSSCNHQELHENRLKLICLNTPSIVLCCPMLSYIFWYFLNILWIFANPGNVPCFRHRLWNSQTIGPRRPRGSSIHGRPFRRHLSNGRNTSGTAMAPSNLQNSYRILTETYLQQILSNLKLRWKKVMDGDGANQCKLLRLDVFNIVQWQGHRSPIWVCPEQGTATTTRRLLRRWWRQNVGDVPRHLQNSSGWDAGNLLLCGNPTPV